MSTSKGGLILVVNNTSTVKIWPGGRAHFCAEGTWGVGGTVKLQTKMPNGTYADVPNSILSENGSLNLDLPAGEVKAVVTTATAVYANLLHMP